MTVTEPSVSTAGQLANQCLAPQHALRTDRQRERDNRRQTLGNDRNGDTDRRQDEISSRFARDGAHDDDGERHEDADECQLLADDVEPTLQRGLLRLDALQQAGDVTELGLHSGRDHHALAAPGAHLRAGVRHADPVAEGQAVAIDRVHLLVDRLGLPGECRLLDSQTGGLDEAHVGRHHRPCVEVDDVARHQLGDRNRRHESAASDARRRNRHPAKCRDGLLGAVLLEEAERGEQHDDRTDRSRLEVLAEHERQECGADQDEHHDRRDLLPEQQQLAGPRRLGQFVRAVLFEPGGRLGGIETIDRPVESIEHDVDRLTVPRFDGGILGRGGDDRGGVHGQLSANVDGSPKVSPPRRTGPADSVRSVLTTGLEGYSPSDMWGHCSDLPTDLTPCRVKRDAVR